MDRQVLGPTRILHEPDVDRLAMRELPPGSTAFLYLMYIAFMRNTSGTDGKPASKTAFYEVSRRWRGCLGFRRKTDHAMCVECAALKSAIQNASDLSSAFTCLKITCP